MHWVQIPVNLSFIFLPPSNGSVVAADGSSRACEYVSRDSGHIAPLGMRQLDSTRYNEFSPKK